MFIYKASFQYNKTLYKCKQYKTKSLYIRHLSNITKTLYKCTWQMYMARTLKRFRVLMYG